MIPELMMAAQAIDVLDAQNEDLAFAAMVLSESSEEIDNVEGYVYDEEEYEESEPDDGEWDGYVHIELDCGHNLAFDCFDAEAKYDYYECAICGQETIYNRILPHECVFELSYGGSESEGCVWFYDCIYGCGEGYGVYEISEEEEEAYWSQYDEGDDEEFITDDIDDEETEYEEEDEDVFEDED